MLRIGATDYNVLFGAKTLRGAVSLLAFNVATEDFHKLRVVYVYPKHFLDSLEIHLMAVCGELNPIRQALGNVLKEQRRTPRVPRTNKPANRQLSICVKSDERPNVASIGYSLRHLRRDVLLLGIAKRPNLIDLDTFSRYVPHGLVLVSGASRPNLTKQAKDCLFAHTSQAGSAAHGATLYQSRDDRDFLRHAEYVRHKPSIRERFRIVNNKVPESAFLLRLLSFCPTRFSGFSGASASLFVGHGFKAALAANLAALASHVAHDLLNYRKFRRLSGFDGLQNNAAGVLDRIKFCISACPLWHIPSVAWMTGGVKA
jgi:hypothetical protein